MAFINANASLLSPLIFKQIKHPRPLSIALDRSLLCSAHSLASGWQMTIHCRVIFFFSYLPNPKTSQQISKFWGWAYWRSIFSTTFPRKLPENLTVTAASSIPPKPLPHSGGRNSAAWCNSQKQSFQGTDLLMPVNPFNLEIVEGEAHIVYDLQKTVQK